MDSHQYLLGAIAVAMSCLLVLAERRAVFVPIAGMIFLSALSPAQDYAGNSLLTWMFPVQEHRVECALIMATPIVVRALAEIGAVPRPRLNAATLLLIVIAVYQGVLRVFHQSLEEGVQTVVFGVLVVGSLALCLPGLLRSRGGLRLLLYSVVAANLAWLVCVLIQLVTDREPLLLGSRFTGLTSNPQSAGIYLALSSVLVLWLVLHEPRGWIRGSALAVLAADALLLLWTGSRTGVISFVLGVFLTIRGSSRRALVSAALLVGPALIVVQLVQTFGAGAPVERLISTGDSGRIQALQRMLQAGLSSPVVGNGIVDANASENSLLLGFAAFGVGMVGLLLALMYSTGRACWRLRARAAGSRTVSSLANAFFAFYVMCFVISLFEGILLGRFRESLVLLVLVNGAVAALLPAHRTTLVRRRSLGASRNRRLVAQVVPDGGNLTGHAIAR